MWSYLCCTKICFIFLFFLWPNISWSYFQDRDAFVATLFRNVYCTSPMGGAIFHLHSHSCLCRMCLFFYFQHSQTVYVCQAYGRLRFKILNWSIIMQICPKHCLWKHLGQKWGKERSPSSSEPFSRHLKAHARRKRERGQYARASRMGLRRMGTFTSSSNTYMVFV